MIHLLHAKRVGDELVISNRVDFLHNACHMMDGGLGLVWNVIGSD